MPCENPWISKKINRGSPEIMSKPTADSAKPKQIEKIVFGKSSPPSPAKVANASNISAKISGLPKSSATDASIGANAVKRIFAIVAPAKDASAAAINAICARPCSANGRPSKVVATAVDAPGIPSATDEIAPPYIAP